MAGEQGEEGKEDGEEPPCLDAGSEHQIDNAEKDLTNGDKISFGHCHTFAHLSTSTKMKLYQTRIISPISKHVVVTGPTVK